MSSPPHYPLPYAFARSQQLLLEEARGEVTLWLHDLSNASGLSEVMGVLQANQIRAAVDLSDLETNPELKRRVEVAVPFHVTLISVDPQKIGVIIPPKP